MAKLTQKTLVFEYFAQRPNKNIEHAEVVDWATEEWERRTQTKLRDPDRMIRTLYQDGVLEKVATGVYRFDPAKVAKVDTRDFSASVKKEIFSRDGHKCVICGRGKKDGMTLHADHIKPRDKGGLGDLANGQTLCSACNMLKKNFGQVEFGKRFFEKMLLTAVDHQDQGMADFASDILKVFEAHGYN